VVVGVGAREVDEQNCCGVALGLHWV